MCESVKFIMGVRFKNLFLWRSVREKEEEFIKLLLSIKQKGLAEGLDESEIKYLISSKCQIAEFEVNQSSRKRVRNITLSIVFVLLIAFAVLVQRNKYFNARCSMENNYIIMEITRPITDCSICKGVKNFTVLENVTKEVFAKYAYLGQPILVKGGCQNWSALRTFSYDFFKDLYSNTAGAFQSVEEECQFFPFRTEFLSLEEVFIMPAERAKRVSSNERTWYIGWSNCNPDISTILRQHYTRPHFLPDDSELSAIDWIFMGYAGQGASMHLDYVQRPSWQAQIAGNKTWYLQPPPECEALCHSMNVTVQKGDIIFIDTNQWYHTTYIEENEMSITIGSEYD